MRLGANLPTILVIAFGAAIGSSVTVLLRGRTASDRATTPSIEVESFVERVADIRANPERYVRLRIRPER